MLRVTVAEAAKLLGITPDGVRMRVRRGSIDHEKDENGRLFVYVDEAELYRNEAQDTSPDAYLAILQDQIEQLRNDVADWKEQLRQEREANRENRRLLAAALERVPPALEAPQEDPSEPQRSPEKAADESFGTSPQEAEDSLQRRSGQSWWQRWFGGIR